MKHLLVASRKGLIIFKRSQGKWNPIRDVFLGQPVSMVYVNPFDGAWWVSLDHGHWGIKLHKSMDEGFTWEEQAAPYYPEGEEIKPGVPASLRYIWSITANNAGKLYLGTEPGGLFIETSGKNFMLNSALWKHPSRQDFWFGAGRDFPGIHSILFDPQDDLHIYVGVSVAGVFESKDGGGSWKPINKGLSADYLPNPKIEVGHDPHLLVMCKKYPEVLWQQNHISIYRSIDGGAQWDDVGEDNGPARFGFAIAADRQDPLTAWVIPAIKDEYRVPVDRALCVCRTTDGGKTWQAFRKGLPQEFCYDLVYRHGLVQDKNELAFGSTSGNLFYSDDGGESWEVIKQHLPLIYCLHFF